MTRTSQYFANHQRFLYELTRPPVKPDVVAKAIRMRAVTKGVQSRLGKLRANQLFDRLMGKGEA